MSGEIPTERGLRPSGFGDDVIARLLDFALDARQIHADKLALTLHDFAANENRIDIARVHAEHDGAVNVVEWHDVDLIRAQHDDIGFFSGSERAHLLLEAIIFRAFYCRKFDHLTRGQQRRQVLLPRALTRKDEHALQRKDGTRLSKEVPGHFRFDICTEAGTDAMRERFLNGWNSVAHPHLDWAGYRNISHARFDQLPIAFREIRAMNVGDVGADGIPDRIQRIRALQVNRNRCAHIAGDAPLRGVGAGGHGQRK